MNMECVKVCLASAYKNKVDKYITLAIKIVYFPTLLSLG